MPKQPKKPHDVVIIGAGILGLWAAEFALRAGRAPLVLEAKTIGAGASGGLLGALMPHQPVGWSAKKALQYEGLTRLPQEISNLEKTTGLTCHYRRSGRIMPIHKEGQKIQSHQWAKGALENWPESHNVKPEWHVNEPNTFNTLWPEHWYQFGNAPLGVNYDTLAACMDPRALLFALAKSIRQKGGDIIENCPVKGLTEEGSILLENGEKVLSNQLIIAAGYQSFPMVMARLEQDLGTGVKGQALLVRPKMPANPNWPIVYDNGLYLIPRPDGDIAIGSTSENNWSHPTETDQQSDALFERAKGVSPLLEEAEILERWAAIRPKTFSRAPYFSHLPGGQRIFLLTGGFKITLGIAHIMAERLIRQMSAL